MQNLRENPHNPQEKKKQSSGTVLFGSNPVMSKLHTVQEKAVDCESATYGGITIKTLYFLLVTVAGIALYHLLRTTLFAGMEQLTVDLGDGVVFSCAMAEVGVVIASLALVIILPIVVAFAKGSIPVAGTLYSLAQGYLLAWIIMTCLTVFNMDYIAWVALGITILLVAIMAVMYATRMIRVTKKFRAVMLVALVTMVASSLLIFVGMFIPGVNTMLAPIAANPVFSIVFELVGIIIATLFLLIDFDTIEYTVTNNLPKKYEWSAAFGLAFTVVWIYLKVLDLLIQLNQKN